MQEAVKIISENGVWVFLIGILTSIIIGIIKTPIRAKWVDSLESGELKTQRENLFDTFTFMSTYVMAFLAAMVYYPLSTKVFSIGEIAKLSLPIWLSQSLAYGAWKKLGIKRALGLLAKLIFKDQNKDGKISLDEAISQVVKGIKEGKFNVEELVSTVNSNLAEVVEDISEAAKGTEEAEKVEEVTKDGVEALAKNMESEVIEAVKESVSHIIGKTNDGVEISMVTPDSKSIKF